VVRRGAWPNARVVATVVGAALAGEPSVGAADETKRVCIDTNEAAQIAQRAGRLREAREKLVFCSADACPPLVRKDCARLLAEVTDSIPSIVVDARDASGATTVRVRAYCDGALVAESLNGLDFPIDPGDHALRFEAPDGRVVEQHVVLNVGEKRRHVAVDFSQSPAQDAAAIPSMAARAAAPARAPESPVPRGSVLPYVLGGIAVVAAASWASFGILGYTKEKSDASGCAPRCGGDELSRLRTDYVIADVSLGVAVAAAGAALTLVLVGRHHPAASTDVRLDLRTTRYGGAVGVSGAW
jgi:hypothetical protein